MWIIVLLLVLDKQQICEKIWHILWLNYQFVFCTYCSNILYFKDLSSLSWQNTIGLLLYDLKIIDFKYVNWTDWDCAFFSLWHSCYYSQCKYDLTYQRVKRWGIVLQGEMLVQLHRLPLSTSMWKWATIIWNCLRC